MIYALAALALFCGYLVWQVRQRDRRIETLEQNDLTVLERFERLADSHRTDVAALHQARMEETAELLQRIQAPDAAVASHAGANAVPDLPPVSLENDQEMFEAYKQRLENSGLVAVAEYDHGLGP